MKTPPNDLDEGTIRRIDWQELCPAVLLPQAVSIATTFRVLWVASLGILLTLLLGLMLNGLSSQQTQNELNRLEADASEALADSDYEKIDTQTRQNIVKLGPMMRQFQTQKASPAHSRKKNDEYLGTLRVPTVSAMLLPWAMMSDSVYRVFPLRSTLFGNAISLIWFLGIWGIWTLCGAIITRTAATQVTIGQYSRWSHIQNYLKERLGSYFAAVLIPVAGLAMCGLAVKIAGWLCMVPVVNFLVAILFPIVLFLGFCFAVIGIGLLFGWPLAFAAVSVDGSDGFDAVSRAYSYVYQRPLQYIVYAAIGIVIGLIGYFFIAWFVDLTLMLIASWGRVPFVDFAALSQQTGAETLKQSPFVHRILFFWCWCFQMVKIGFLFGYFWVCTTVIYVILRRSVDGTPIDEIHFPKDQKPQIQTIPPITPFQVGHQPPGGDVGESQPDAGTSEA